MRARTITRQCPARRLWGGASEADRLACAGAEWPSGLDPPTQGGEKCERWSCQHLQVASNSANSGWAVCASTRPRARTRAAGAAVLCSARDCPSGNGWRWRPEPLRYAAAPLVDLRDKTFRQPLSVFCRRPLHGEARGCVGLGAAVPAAPRSVTIGTSAQRTTGLYSRCSIITRVLRSTFTRCMKAFRPVVFRWNGGSGAIAPPGAASPAARPAGLLHPCGVIAILLGEDVCEDSSSAVVNQNVDGAPMVAFVGRCDV